MAKIVVIINHWYKFEFFLCVKICGNVQSLRPSAKCSWLSRSFPVNLWTTLSYPHV